MLLNSVQVKNFIPHREPFLFIDGVESISEVPSTERINHVEDSKLLIGTEVLAYFHVKNDLDIFKGHFPGHPVLPGVIQIEMMAQASCFGVYRLFKRPNESNIQVAFGKVENAKFRRPVYPGQDLIIYAKLIKTRGDVMGFDCTLMDRQKRSIIFAECSILATISFPTTQQENT